MSDSGNAAEGWYFDPIRPERLRYFDGFRWSDRTHSSVSAQSKPIEAGWFPDPLNADCSRYFDGTAWTDSVRATSVPESSGSLRVPAIQDRPLDSLAQGDDADKPKIAQQVLPRTGATSAKSRTWLRPLLIIAAVALPLIVGGILVGLMMNRPGSLNDSATLREAEIELPWGIESELIEGVSLGDFETVAYSVERLFLPAANSTKDRILASQLEAFSGYRARAIPRDAPDVGLSDTPTGSTEIRIDQVECPPAYVCFLRRIHNVRTRVYTGDAVGPSETYRWETLVLDSNTKRRLNLSDFVAPDQREAFTLRAWEAFEAIGAERRDETTGNPANGFNLNREFTGFIPQDDGVQIVSGRSFATDLPVAVFVPWNDPVPLD